MELPCLTPLCKQNDLDRTPFQRTHTFNLLYQFCKIQTIQGGNSALINAKNNLKLLILSKHFLKSSSAVKTELPLAVKYFTVSPRTKIAFVHPRPSLNPKWRLSVCKYGLEISGMTSSNSLEFILLLYLIYLCYINIVTFSGHWLHHQLCEAG